MKAIQVTPLYPPHLGGMENVAKEVSERLAKKGHQVEVFTSDIVGYKKEEKFKDRKNLKIHYLRNWKRSYNPIIAPFLFNKLMKIPKDSIIHVHVAQALFPEIAYLISRIRRVPYVAQIHCDVEPSSLLGKIILKPYKRIFLKKFLKKANKIIVLTEGYKKLITKVYSIDKNKIIVIPNGVGEEFFTERKNGNKIPHLLFVGRISIEKNLPRLIEAVSLCKSKFILDVVGDGKLLDEIKKLVKQKNIKNIIFHGKKIGKYLIKIYSNSDAFISTSNGEAFPLTILEAMGSRLPVIASDVNGNHDVVKNVGILVNPPTPENFAKEIDRLFSDKKLYNKLSKQSLKFAKKHTWDNVIVNLEKVYEEVLREHNKKLKKRSE